MDYMDDTMIGDPVDQSSYWEMQTEPDNCAVAAELSIMHQFDVDLTQDQANYISAENGWYHPGGGTSPDDIGNMMDLYNIPNHTCVEASVADLASELQQGHGVIVGVNSGDLWDQGPLENLSNFLRDELGIAPSNHAVVVTGIDTSDPLNPMVILNNSGVENGAGAKYPLDQFLDAWENSDCYYTATDNPMPRNNMEDIGDIDFSKWIGAGAGFGAGIGTFLSTGDISTAFNTGIVAAQAVGETAEAIGEAVGAAANFLEGYFSDPNNIALI